MNGIAINPSDIVMIEFTEHVIAVIIPVIKLPAWISVVPQIGIVGITHGRPIHSELMPDRRVATHVYQTPTAIAPIEVCFASGTIIEQKVCMTAAPESCQGWYHVPRVSRSAKMASQVRQATCHRSCRGALRQRYDHRTEGLYDRCPQSCRK